MLERPDQREPLWASSLKDQPRSEYADVIARVVEEPEDVPSKSGDRQPGGRSVVIPAALAALGMVTLAVALDGPGSVTIADVPSYWDDVPMTCHTLRIEQEERAVEWFSCRALGGRRLPPGLYLAPESQWTSDITRRAARDSRIRISPDGEVAGWATY